MKDNTYIVFTDDLRHNPCIYPLNIQQTYKLRLFFRRFYRDHRHSGCNLLQISLCIVIAQHNARTHVFIFTNAFQQIYRNLVFSPGMLTAQIYIIKQYFFLFILFHHSHHIHIFNAIYSDGSS